MKDYSQYKTDEERMRIAPSVPSCDFGILATWEQEADSKEAKRILHSYAISAYHRDEYDTYGEV